MIRQWIVNLLFVGMGIALSGCTIPFLSEKVSRAPIIEEIRRTPVEKIVISELDILDRPYALLGEVSAIHKSLIPFNSIATKEELNLKLREEAAKINADAIIFVSYKPLEKSWNSFGGMEAKGKAVRFTRY